MVQEVVERYYLGVTRFMTSSFMRAPGALAKRNLSPYTSRSRRPATAAPGAGGPSEGRVSEGRVSEGRVNGR